GGATTATGEGRGKGDFGNAEHFHEIGGVHFVHIAGAGAGIVGKAIDLLDVEACVLTGGHNGLTGHFIDRLWLRGAPWIVGRGADTDDRGLVLMFPGHWVLLWLLCVDRGMGCGDQRLRVLPPAYLP